MPSKNPPKKRTRTPSPQRAARKVRLAAGALAGKTVTEMAEAEGISRSYASRELNADPTRQIVADMLAAHAVPLTALVARSLRAIGDAMDARGAQLGKTRIATSSPKGAKKVKEEYELFDLGPDHYARLTAVRRLIDLLTAGRPTPKAAEPGKQADGLPTWEDFKRLYEAHETSS